MLKMFLKYNSVYKVVGLLYFCFYEAKPDIISSTDSNSAYLSCESSTLASCPSGYLCNFEINKCIPYCSFDCGPGRCIAPEECECDQGYYSEALTDDSEPPRCKPVCEFCEGKCIQPYTCVCGPEFDAINLSADGGDCDCFGNCTGRICESTKCIPKTTVETKTIQLSTSLSNSPTSTSTTRSYADISDRNKEVTKTRTEDYSYELFSTEADINQFYLDTFQVPETERQRTEAKNNGAYWWIYLTAGMISLLIVVTVLFVKRNAVFYCFRGNSYSVVEGKLGETHLHSMDMDFLTIE